MKCDAHCSHSPNGRTSNTSAHYGHLMSRLLGRYSNLTAGWMKRDSIPSMDKIFFFTDTSCPALEPTSFLFAVFRGVFFLGVRRSWPKSDHSSPFRAEVKNTWSYTFATHLSFGVYVDNFTSQYLGPW